MRAEAAFGSEVSRASGEALAAQELGQQVSQRKTRASMKTVQQQSIAISAEPSARSYMQTLLGETSLFL